MEFRISRVGQSPGFAGRVTLGDASDDDHSIYGTTQLVSEHASDPAAPAAGSGGIIYVKNDGKLYFASDAVTATDLTSGGGLDAAQVALASQFFGG
jgi:archaellum component FlaG (FlaF/FlaG flagellin family)